MDSVHHISPPPTPTFSSGHFFSKTKASIKSSTQRVLYKRHSVSQLPFLKSQSEVSILLDSDRHPPEDHSGGRPTIFRSRANSSSSPALPLLEEEDAGPLREVKHRPSVPTLKLTHRPPVNHPSLRSPKSLGEIFNLTPVEPLPLVVDFNKPPLTPVYAEVMEPASRNVDVSEAVVNYGPGYGVGSGVHRNNGNTTASGGNLQNPAMIYQHIHELSAKRISTLDHLRKA